MKTEGKVLLMLLAAAASGCVSGISREISHPAPIVKAAPSNPNLINVNYPEPPSAEIHQSIVKDFKVVQVALKEEYKDILCEVDIKYPRIEQANKPGQRRFNVYVKSLIVRNVREIKKVCMRTKRYANGELRKGNYYLGIDYELLHGTKDLISVRLVVESFTGYLNADWATIGINFDLKSGRLLKLTDVFDRKSGYLESISQFCMRELEKRDLTCSGGTSKNSEVQFIGIRKGASAKLENYEHWNILANGIRITFGEYQIGAGCLGQITVDVPYDVVKANVSRTSPLWEFIR